MFTHLYRTVCAAAIAATVAVLTVTLRADAFDTCQNQMLWDNFKDEVPLWFDKHGHSSGQNPGSPWEYTHSLRGDADEDEPGPHVNFVDNGYADEAGHTICEPGTS